MVKINSNWSDLRYTSFVTLAKSYKTSTLFASLRYFHEPHQQHWASSFSKTGWTKSVDNGETWEYPHVIHEGSEDESTNPDWEEGGLCKCITTPLPNNESRLLIVWCYCKGIGLEYTSFDNNRYLMYCRHSDDGGNTWSSDRQISTDNFTFLYSCGNTAEDSFGNIYVPVCAWNEGKNYCLKSIDKGLTWTVISMPDVSTNLISEGGIYCRSDNSLLAVFRSDRDQAALYPFYYTISIDQGVTWSAFDIYKAPQNISPNIGMYFSGMNVSLCKARGLDFLTFGRDPIYLFWVNLLTGDFVRLTDVASDIPDYVHYTSMVEITPGVIGVAWHDNLLYSSDAWFSIVDLNAWINANPTGVNTFMAISKPQDIFVMHGQSNMNGVDETHGYTADIPVGAGRWDNYAKEWIQLSEPAYYGGCTCAGNFAKRWFALTGRTAGFIFVSSGGRGYTTGIGGDHWSDNMSTCYTTAMQILRNANCNDSLKGIISICGEQDAYDSASEADVLVGIKTTFLNFRTDIGRLDLPVFLINIFWYTKNYPPVNRAIQSYVQYDNLAFLCEDATNYLSTLDGVHMTRDTEEIMGLAFANNVYTVLKNRIFFLFLKGFIIPEIATSYGFQVHYLKIEDILTGKNKDDFFKLINDDGSNLKIIDSNAISYPIYIDNINKNEKKMQLMFKFKTGTPQRAFYLGVSNLSIINSISNSKMFQDNKFCVSCSLTGDGSVLVDRSLKTNISISSGALTSVEAKYSGALKLVSDRHIRITNYPNPIEYFTVELLIKLLNYPPVLGGIFSFGVDGGNRIRCYIVNDLFRIDARDSGSSGMHEGSRNILPLNEWFLMHVTYDKDLARPDNMKLYINGARLNTLVYSGTMPNGFNIASPYIINIGGINEQYPYNNLIVDEINIYNECRSNTQINQRYSELFGILYSSTIVPASIKNNFGWGY